VHVLDLRSVPWHGRICLIEKLRLKGAFQLHSKVSSTHMDNHTSYLSGKQPMCLKSKQNVAIRCKSNFNAHRHRSILEAAGHIILTPANQLMVMGLKMWSLSTPGSNQRPFDHWPTSLPTALTGLPSTWRQVKTPDRDKIYLIQFNSIQYFFIAILNTSKKMDFSFGRNSLCM
jgi:hypothetical protein